MKALILLVLPAALAARTLIIITPHGDDFVFYAGGSIARMTAEGWDAYLVRVANDEKHSTGVTTEETRLRTRQETEAAARILGIKEVIHLNRSEERRVGKECRL